LLAALCNLINSCFLDASGHGINPLKAALHFSKKIQSFKDSIYGEEVCRLSLEIFHHKKNVYIVFFGDKTFSKKYYKQTQALLHL